MPHRAESASQAPWAALKASAAAVTPFAVSPARTSISATGRKHA